ncbi:MAG: excinuclease ABC subunit UvrC [Candidatus Jacksonbacteria bacterium]|jgi:excinuclease ABC subunit C|nr:excinuclease ABC subunit UvrC [Candidatus Jacksonbacteria bacterium]MBT6301473.1 excinuclease ABC subunit UvrC [Candidatus Jacksonbacteria bacterium]MBT6757142.1 excinuclease ABC subunit UvrC [Candidatus Jacksonbacteria bacterium]MBT6955354.1 excinuclease ABC subunit UvrC [Candidatus Jacksonbacteria bacterium]MBT7008531.1 excinuclease ABC subunit UvrC [Candidatus Jacksonbacteria bacterium]
MKFNAQNIPTSPGVYLFKNKQKEVLYIGKAKNLRKRVASYWQKQKDLEPHKYIMLQQIEDIQTIITDTETEALVLESILIKKHQPAHNILLKDNKSHSYIKITTKKEWPTISIVRRPAITPGARYFGPYLAAYKVEIALRSLKNIFPFRTKEKGSARACLQYHMKRCTEPCLHTQKAEANNQLKVEYGEIVENIIKLLEGKTDEVVNYIQANMQNASQEKNFEGAAKWRDRLRAINHFKYDGHKISQTKKTNQDVISFIRDAKNKNVVVNVFKIRRGNVIEKTNFTLQHIHTSPFPEIITAFLLQYYPHSPNLPKEIVVPYTPTISESQLQKILHTKTKISIPTRGKMRQLLKLGEKNAQEYLTQQLPSWEKNKPSQGSHSAALQELQKDLQLPAFPKRIECYDISNIQGTSPVGSMVVFVDGKPAKDQYRKFKIKTIKGPNDVAMMKEVLLRRFQHLKTQKKQSWPTPNLVVVDGGKGQLSAAVSIWNMLELNIPLIALAKKEEDIYIPRWSNSSPLPSYTLKKLSTSTTKLRILQYLRDEAHRFAIGYFRTRHKASHSSSLLDSVPGIGPKRKKDLLKKFGSISEIKKAKNSELFPLLGKKMTAILREYI